MLLDDGDNVLSGAALVFPVELLEQRLYLATYGKWILM
jgi:hypothetical protein